MILWNEWSGGKVVLKDLSVVDPGQSECVATSHEFPSSTFFFTLFLPLQVSIVTKQIRIPFNNSPHLSFLFLLFSPKFASASFFLLLLLTPPRTTLAQMFQQKSSCNRNYYLFAK